MSRNVVAQGTPDRSFAGLMDHLTGFSREDVSHSGTEPDFGVTFRRNSNFAVTDTSLTNPRAAARAILSVTEKKPGRNAPIGDAAELSYERALRIHGRRRGPQVALHPPPASVSSSKDRRANLPVQENDAVRKSAPGQKPETDQLKSQGSETTADLPSARGAARKPKQNARTAKPPKNAPAPVASRQTSGPANPRQMLRANPGKSSVASGKQVQSPPEKRKKPQLAAARASEKIEKPFPECIPKARDTSKARRKHKSPAMSFENRLRSIPVDELTSVTARGKAIPQEAQTPLTGYRSSTAEVMEPELAKTQLELLHPLRQLDQRSTIVSVRLTEGEFACLRDRAEESGISVSAYMRSCVVDADQLRAQVKRALAEMRALHAPAGAAQIALTQSSRRSSETTHGWFQLVLRPLTFLFGPLFPSRRSV